MYVSCYHTLAVVNKKEGEEKKMSIASHLQELRSAVRHAAEHEQVDGVHPEAASVERNARSAEGREAERRPVAVAHAPHGHRHWEDGGAAAAVGSRRRVGTRWRGVRALQAGGRARERGEGGIGEGAERMSWRRASLPKGRRLRRYGEMMQEGNIS